MFPDSRDAFVSNCRYSRVCLIAAGLVLAGTLNGCQSARTQSAAGGPTGTSYITARNDLPQEPAPQPPSLRGLSEPVPAGIPEEPATRPIFPRASEQPQSSRSSRGPAFRLTPDESDDDDDDDLDDDAPRFPGTGRQRPGVNGRHESADAGPATNSARTALVDHSGRDAKENPQLPRRVPLPLTRRLPAESAANGSSQDRPFSSGRASEPIRLAEPPALFPAPTDRQ